MKKKSSKSLSVAPGRFNFEDIHRKLFGKRTPKRRSVEEMKEGIGEYVRSQYARRHSRD